MAATVNIYQELVDMITRISQKNTYYNNRISQSIMKQFEIVVAKDHIGVLVPYWLPVTQKGRGPRRTNTSSGLIDIIYRWMEKRNYFKSKTKRGRIGEAWAVTRKINKLGNAQFREGKFIDIYESERKKTIEKINEKYSKYISEITMQVI